MANSLTSVSRGLVERGGILLMRCQHTVGSLSVRACLTCIAAPHAKIDNHEAQNGSDAPVKDFCNLSGSIFDEDEGSKCGPGFRSKNHFCCRNVDKKDTDANEDSQTPLKV